MNKESQEKYLQKLAKRNVCDGILREPRLYFDQLAFPVGTSEVRSAPECFRNGEQFPVVITHICMQMRRNEGGAGNPAQGDERLISRYGVRFRNADSFYMSSRFVQIPLFHNVNASASPVVTQGQVTWNFPFVVPLGQRDSFVVDTQLFAAPVSTRPVSVAFNGLGRASRRPYQLSSTINLNNAVQQQLDPSDFRNDGAEVIDITQMTAFVGANDADNDPVGNIREARFGIRQTGNGTNANWQSGPNTGSLLAPGPLWGPDVGRCVIHRLPGDGWVFDPGQGVSVDMISSDTARAVEEAIDISMCGYIVVT